MKWLLRIFLGLIVIGVSLLLIVRYAGPSFATSKINTILAENFDEGSRFDGFDLTLHRGKVGLKELIVGQPKGFSGKPMFQLGGIEADLDLFSITSDTVIIENLRILNPALFYQVNQEGLSNFEAALDALVPSWREPSEEEEEEEPTTPPNKKLLVRNLEILGVQLSAASQQSGDQVDLNLENLNLTINNFLFDPADPEYGPRILELVLNLSLDAINASQPAGFEKDLLLGLQGFDFAASVSDARPGEMVIENIVLNQPFASFQQAADGKSNIDALIKAFIPAAFAQSEDQQPVAEVDTSPAAPESQPTKSMTLALESFRIEDAGFHFANLDPSAPLSFEMSDLKFLLSGVSLDPLANEVTVSSLSLEDGRFNLLRSSPSEEKTKTLADQSSPASTDETVEGEVVAEAQPLPAGRIFLDSFSLANFSFDIRDEVLASEPLVYRLAPITSTVRNLDLDTRPGANPSPAEIDFEFTLDQGEEIQKAFFKSQIIATDLTNRIPSVATFVRFTGFDLQPLRPLLPPGTITALGGSGLDLVVDLKVSEDLLDGNLAIINNKGNRTALPIKGTPDKPEVSLQDIFTAILGRPLDMAGNLAGGAIDAAGAITEGAVAAASDLGKGATKTVSRIGGGLMSGVRGVASGNLEEVSGGLKEATVGAAGEATGAVREGTGSATKGVSGATAAATGGAAVEQWKKLTPERHATTVATAKEWLSNIQFPLTGEQ
ncbi:MAG: hypothetical protein ACFCU4_01180 [Puniceicoccaceae bacterium]